MLLYTPLSMTRSIVVLEGTLYEYSLEHIKHFGRRLQFFVRATNPCVQTGIVQSCSAVHYSHQVSHLSTVGTESKICRMSL